MKLKIVLSEIVCTSENDDLSDMAYSLVARLPII